MVVYKKYLQSPQVVPGGAWYLTFVIKGAEKENDCFINALASHILPYIKYSVLETKLRVTQGQKHVVSDHNGERGIKDSCRLFFYLCHETITSIY